MARNLLESELLSRFAWRVVNGLVPKRCATLQCALVVSFGMLPHVYQTRTTWKLSVADDAATIKARYEPKLAALGLTYHWWQSGPAYPGHMRDHVLLLVIDWRSRAHFEAVKATESP